MTATDLYISKVVNILFGLSVGLLLGTILKAQIELGALIIGTEGVMMLVLQAIAFFAGDETFKNI